MEPGDTLYVALSVPPELSERFAFQHGQYLTLSALVDDQTIQRSYSICAAVGEPPAIAIQKIDNGRFSHYAHTHFQPGQTLMASPPAGQFTSELDATTPRKYLCIAAGSGITPVLSIIKTLLLHEPDAQVTLLYGNRRSTEVIFREALSWLKNAFLTRFQWINLFTRDTQQTPLFNGRIDEQKIQAIHRELIDVASYDRYFLCGPEGMVSDASRGLLSAGVNQADIRYELFFSSAQTDHQRAVNRHARARDYGDLAASVHITAGGRQISLALTADGQSILDSGFAAGLELPFSCKGGVCATCKAKLLEGQVEMDKNHALSAAEVAAGYILTCQSHPISPHVVIDFDAP